MTAATFLVACALLAFHTVAPAYGHDQPFSYLDLHVEPHGATLALTLHRDDAAAIVNTPPDSLDTPAELADLANVVGRRVASHLRLTGDGRALSIRRLGGDPSQKRKSVSLRYAASWDRVPGRIDVTVGGISSDPQHETFLNVYEDGALHRQDVLTATRSRVSVYTAGRNGWRAVLATFVPAGIHHIFIGPDHILFVIGLLLLGGGLGRVLKIVTAFTVAHSVTLALAAFQIVTPPARLIEPLIALSVVYVGFENLRFRQGGRDVRVPLAFLFGLVHGFGFASVLREFGLPREALGVSLLGFNAGVEIGQLCIVLAVSPILSVLRERAPSVVQRATFVGACGIVIAGAFWFVSRALTAG